VTDYDWIQIRTLAITRFGETPGRELEAEIIQAFERAPGHVAAILDTIAAEHNAGASFRSPWAIARARARLQPEPRIIADTTERDRRIAQAEAWIRNAGLYLDRRTELTRELFGPQGKLRDWFTLDLASRMTAYWRHNRPRGEQAEEAAEQRARDRKELRKRLEAQRSAASSTSSSASPPSPSESSSSPTPSEHSEDDWHLRPEPEHEEATA
jgi:hypothetical protein